MLNIAIFSPSQNPYSETFIQAHKNYLKGNVFYYYGRGEEIRLENKGKLATASQRLGLKLWYKIRNKPTHYFRDFILLKSLKKENIQVILVEYGTHAHHLSLLLQKSKLPVVVHFHGYDASVPSVIEQCQQYKNVFSLASQIVAVSKQMRQMLLDIGCPEEKLVYNTYGSQPEFARVVPTFSKKQFVGIGRFTDKKAPYYTIMAFSQVIKKYPEARLMLAGTGVLLNTCKNLVKQYKLTNQVLFLGVISPEQYCTLLSESLAFVQHSVTADNGDMEGTPLAVLEASSAGLPVISTNHAGIPDVIVHEKSGLLCDEHDVDTMAANMLLLLDDISFAKKLGAYGKKHIEANFTMTRHIEKLNEILLNTISHK